MKKIIIFMMLFSSFFLFNQVNANSWETQDNSKEVCEDWNCLDKPNFMVDTSAFSIWKNDLKNNEWSGSWKKTINAVLWTIIQKLMIVLWTLSFAIITIWGYFMITSHWDDSLLTKWKNVVKWWILSLVIALSSYYIVNMVSYILYK